MPFRPPRNLARAGVMDSKPRTSQSRPQKVVLRNFRDARVAVERVGLARRPSIGLELPYLEGIRINRMRESCRRLRALQVAHRRSPRRGSAPDAARCSPPPMLGPNSVSIRHLSPERQAMPAPSRPSKLRHSAPPCESDAGRRAALVGARQLAVERLAVHGRLTMSRQ